MPPEHAFTLLHVVLYVHTWVEYGGRSARGVSLVVEGIVEMSSPVPNGGASMRSWNWESVLLEITNNDRELLDLDPLERCIPRHHVKALF